MVFSWGWPHLGSEVGLLSVFRAWGTMTSIGIVTQPKLVIYGTSGVTLKRGSLFFSFDGCKQEIQALMERLALWELVERSMKPSQNNERQEMVIESRLDEDILDNLDLGSV